MAIIEKTKQCAGTMSCRFRVVLRLAIALLIIGIAIVLFFFVGDAN